LDYFEAVQEGRKRVDSAMVVLQEVAGPCYSMLFLKLGTFDWTPVGKEQLHAVVPGKDNTSALVICDADGNAKAMSSWVSVERAEELAKILESKGIPRFRGKVGLPI
jgi:hypothetical protein